MNTKVIEDQVDHLGDRHTGQASQTVLTPEHDTIGLAGEHAVGAMLNQYPFIHDGYDGDDGYDFLVGLTYRLDVKTSTVGYLYVQETKIDNAQIYVACSYNKETKTATPVGWMWREKVKRYPLTDPQNAGKPARTVPHRDLRPISELLNRMATIKYGEP